MPRSSPETWLPPLPFGDGVSRIRRDTAVCDRAMSVVLPSLRSCEALGDRRLLRQRVAAVELGGVSIVACASSPLVIRTGPHDRTLLLVPCHGGFTLRCGTASWDARAGVQAIVIRGRDRPLELVARSTWSALILGVDLPGLEDAARSIVPANARQRAVAALDRDQTLPLERGDVSFDAVFRRLAGVLDAGATCPGFLARCGVDGAILRTLAMAMLPSGMTGMAAGTARPDGDAARVGAVCEYIRSHLGEPLALGDLERVYGLGARSLQIAFRRETGLSPTRWICEERLTLARERLREAARTDGSSVADVAARCGFRRLASFSREYSRRFGELPSETIARRGR